MTFEAFLKTHPKITRSLKKFVLDYQDKLDSDTFAAFLINLSEELEKAAFLFQSLPAGPERAFKLHQMVEEEIAEGDNIKVSCFKGCSACCHMEVEVTNYEADVIAGLIHDGFVVDRDRLKSQSTRTLQDPLWREGMKNKNNPCVFLNAEGACGIYEKRPVMCRRHSVTSPAKNCESIEAAITLRYFPKVDLLISAANEDPNMEIGPLAKMLQIRL
ncbi:Flagellin N-methylase [compost metagenome]